MVITQSDQPQQQADFSGAETCSRNKLRTPLTILFCCLVCAFHLVQSRRLTCYNNIVKDDGMVQAATAIEAPSTSAGTRSGDSSNKRPRRVLCSSTRNLFSATNADMERAWNEAERFHNHGGNLKVIQEYLDRQLDPTFSNLGVRFNSNAGKVVQNDIDHSIHEALKRGDVNHRGGYDQRQLPGSFVPPLPKVIAGGRHVDVHEPHTFEKWKAAIGPIGPNCTSMDRIQQRAKNPSYEDKFMCSYLDLARVSSISSCDIMSIGSNDQWGFERAVMRHVPNCRTHTFDCTISKPQRKPTLDNVKFYSICIASQDLVQEGRHYNSYATMYNLTGMKGPPRLLKMDVEGFEYDVLSSMMSNAAEDDSLLPEQIVVELHTATRMYDLPWLLRSRQAAEVTLLIGQMYRQGGYLPVYVDYNPGCGPCLEVLFVKVLCHDE